MGYIFNSAPTVMKNQSRGLWTEVGAYMIGRFGGKVFIFWYYCHITTGSENVIPSMCKILLVLKQVYNYSISLNIPILRDADNE